MKAKPNDAESKEEAIKCLEEIRTADIAFMAMMRRPLAHWLGFSYQRTVAFKLAVKAAPSSNKLDKRPLYAAVKEFYENP